MRESRPAPVPVPYQSDSNRPVPAARPMSEFSAEWIGDEVVLFDPDLNRYHTLNRVAYDIWQLCDGTRAIDQIANASVGHRSAVEMATEQLGEAGLLKASELAFESRMPRRKLLKLVSAGALGVGVLPLVNSITVPNSASAGTGDECVPGVLDCPNDNNGNAQCCCLNGSGKKYVCRACPC